MHRHTATIAFLLLAAGAPQVTLGQATGYTNCDLASGDTGDFTDTSGTRGLWDVFLSEDGVNWYGHRTINLCEFGDIQTASGGRVYVGTFDGDSFTGWWYQGNAGTDCYYDNKFYDCDDTLTAAVGVPLTDEHHCWGRFSFEIAPGTREGRGIFNYCDLQGDQGKRWYNYGNYHTFARQHGH